MARCKARTVQMDNDKVIIQFNNANIKEPISNLNKSGLIMWLYFMTLEPGEEIVINAPDLEKRMGITRNIITRGLASLEEQRYLVDGVFYAAPHITVQRSWDF